MCKYLFEAPTKQEANPGALHAFLGVHTVVSYRECEHTLSAPAPVNCLGRSGQDAQTGDKGLSVVSLRGVFLKNCLLSAVGLCCCAGLSLVVESKGCPLGAVSGLLILVASLVVSTGSRARGVQQLQPPGPGPAPVNWAQAQESWCPGLVALNVWDLPRSGIEPVSPALAGGFFTAEPPGTPQGELLFARESGT